MLKKSNLSLTALAAFGAGLVGLGKAQAQDNYHVIKRDRPLNVRERPKPDYDALGVNMGAFRLFPELAVSAQSSNNVFAAPSPDEEEDLVATARLSARLQSQWSNHEMRLYASAASTSYQDFSDNDTTAWNGGLASRLDVARDFQIYFDVNAARVQDPPMTTPSDLIVAEFVEYDQTNMSLSLVKDFANVRVAAGARQTSFDFDDGVLEGGASLEADDRDRTIEEASLRADVTISPGLALFVEGRANRREFDLTPPETSVNRNSEGYRAVAGVRFEATNVIQGEIGVGQYTQTYEEAGQEDSEGSSAHVAVQWAPDELVSLRLGVEREVADTGAFGAISEVRDNAELALDYEFRRNMIFGLQAASTRADFEGIDREDDRFSAAATLDWQFNRALGASLAFEHYEQSSDGADPGRDYEVDQVRLTLRLRR